MSHIYDVVGDCLKNIEERNYAPWRQESCKEDGYSFAKWIDENNLTNKYLDAACDYLDYLVGAHLYSNDLTSRDKLLIRNVRMLGSYADNGFFEFRTPKVERKLSGIDGQLIKDYLSYCENDLGQSDDPIRNKKYHLSMLNEFLQSRKLRFENIDFQILQECYIDKNFSLASVHNANPVIRVFFEYLEFRNLVTKPISRCVIHSNYKNQAKLPTTYEEDEIKDLLSSVDRTSPVGKRDYLILLLASEYGMRAGDIASLQFSPIDWDNNLLTVQQSKTGTVSTYPLLSSVGNAIIDFLRNSRYESDSSYIILSFNNVSRHQPLKAETIHSVVTKAFKRSKVKNWNKKSMGHMLYATRMVKPMAKKYSCKSKNPGSKYFLEI